MKLKHLSRPISALALLAFLAFVLSANAQSAPRRIDISAKRFNFTPNALTLKKGEPVVLVLKSEDTTHGIRIKELGVDFKAAKGQTTEFPFTPNKTGDFTVHCATFCGSGHGTMMFTIHVAE